MFGIVVCAASIVMLVESSKFDSTASDIMWDTVPTVEWSIAEIHLSVIACSLPIMHPFFHALRKKIERTFTPTDRISHVSVSLTGVSSSRYRDGAESTRQLANSVKSNNETTFIYGQGPGTDVVITGKSQVDKNEEREQAGAETHGIIVKNEVNLLFSNSSFHRN